MENVTSRSEEHVIYGDQNSRGQNSAVGQTSDPTTWVNNTPPKKNLSPLIGHVTIGKGNKNVFSNNQIALRSFFKNLVKWQQDLKISSIGNEIF